MWRDVAGRAGTRAGHGGSCSRRKTHRPGYAAQEDAGDKVELAPELSESFRTDALPARFADSAEPEPPHEMEEGPGDSVDRHDIELAVVFPLLNNPPDQFHFPPGELIEHVEQCGLHLERGRQFNELERHEFIEIAEPLFFVGAQLVGGARLGWKNLL